MRLYISLILVINLVSALLAHLANASPVAPHTPSAEYRTELARATQLPPLGSVDQLSDSSRNSNEQPLNTTHHADLATVGPARGLRRKRAARNEIGESSSSARETSAREDCPICLEPLEREAAMKTPCSHRFHSRCMDNHQRSASSENRPVTCPICRAFLSEERANQRCTICGELNHGRRSYLLPCRHEFHRECLRYWNGRVSIQPRTGSSM